MAERRLSNLRSAYVVGEEIVVTDLPAGTTQALVRTAWGTAVETSLVNGTATVVMQREGTYAFESRSTSDTLLAEEFFSVRRNPGDDPIMGFVTSFDDVSRPAVLEWLQDLRCSVVQVYDWMESYSSPLPKSNAYQDPLGRAIDRAALERLILGIRGLGAVAQAYAPVCAADDELADDHPQWRLFRNDGAPESLGNLLQIMDPGNAGWQQYWIENYGTAADALGFNGFHLDTYGYPRNAVNSADEPVSVSEGYRAFVAAVREARPTDVLSFNQVNGVPRGFVPPSLPSFRYVEVWPPNGKWRHLEALLDRSAGGHPRQGDTLAIYPPVWDENRDSALRTTVCSEAVATVLGANTLIWGDDHGVLCRPYYVDHERLLAEEVGQVLEWHRFGLRCRDLFKSETDTSWYELADENASVVVSWDGESSPEPEGGSLFARVVRGDDCVVVSLLDLSGNADGSWAKTTGRGSCVSAEVSVLVDSLDCWRVDVATIGRDGGRFSPLATSIRSMREGDGLSCVVPLGGGWSVLRLVRKEAS